MVANKEFDSAPSYIFFLILNQLDKVCLGIYFFTTDAQEFPFSASWRILYFSIKDLLFVFSFVTFCWLIERMIYFLTISLTAWFVFFSSIQCPQIQYVSQNILEGIRLIVPLMQSFLLKRPKNMVLLSESPSYRGSHINEVIWLKKSRKI